MLLYVSQLFAEKNLSKLSLELVVLQHYTVPVIERKEQMLRGEGANTQSGKRSTIKDYLIDILKTVQGITRILTDLSKGELRYVQKKKNCSKKVHLKSLKYQ